MRADVTVPNLPVCPGNRRVWPSQRLGFLESDALGLFALGPSPRANRAPASALEMVVKYVSPTR